jgi:hypothetical protein
MPERSQNDVNFLAKVRRNIASGSSHFDPEPAAGKFAGLAAEVQLKRVAGDRVYDFG